MEKQIEEMARELTAIVTKHARQQVARDTEWQYSFEAATRSVKEEIGLATSQLKGLREDKVFPVNAIELEGFLRGLTVAAEILTEYKPETPIKTTKP